MPTPNIYIFFFFDISSLFIDENENNSLIPVRRLDSNTFKDVNFVSMEQ